MRLPKATSNEFAVIGCLKQKSIFEQTNSFSLEIYSIQKLTFIYLHNYFQCRHDYNI